MSHIIPVKEETLPGKSPILEEAKMSDICIDCVEFFGYHDKVNDGELRLVLKSKPCAFCERRESETKEQTEPEKLRHGPVPREQG